MLWRAERLGKLSRVPEIHSSVSGSDIHRSIESRIEIDIFHLHEASKDVRCWGKYKVRWYQHPWTFIDFTTEVISKKCTDKLVILLLLKIVLAYLLKILSIDKYRTDEDWILFIISLVPIQLLIYKRFLFLFRVRGLLTLMFSWCLK